MNGGGCGGEGGRGVSIKEEVGQGGVINVSFWSDVFDELGIKLKI